MKTTLLWYLQNIHDKPGELTETVLEYYHGALPAACCGAKISSAIGDAKDSLTFLGKSNLVGIEISNQVGINYTEENPDYVLDKIELVDGKYIYIRSAVGYSISVFSAPKKTLDLKYDDISLHTVYFNSVRNFTDREIHERNRWKYFSDIDIFRSVLDPIKYRFQLYILENKQLPEFKQHMEKYKMDKWLLAERHGIINLNYSPEDNPRLNWYLFDLQKE